LTRLYNALRTTSDSLHNLQQHHDFHKARTKNELLPVEGTKTCGTPPSSGIQRPGPLCPSGRQLHGIRCNEL